MQVLGGPLARSHLARCRRPTVHGAAGTNEQGDAQRRFEVLDAAADGGLRNVQAFCSATEMQIFGDGKEVLDKTRAGIDALHVSVDLKRDLYLLGSRVTLQGWNGRAGRSIMNGRPTRIFQARRS